MDVYNVPCYILCLIYMYVKVLCNYTWEYGKCIFCAWDIVVDFYVLIALLGIDDCLAVTISWCCRLIRIFKSTSIFFPLPISSVVSVPIVRLHILYTVGQSMVRSHTRTRREFIYVSAVSCMCCSLSIRTRKRRNT